MLWWLSSIRIPKSNGSQAIKRWLRSVRIFNLLEKGHAKRGGGRVRAFPHIAPAEQAGIRKLEEGIKRGLEG